MITVWEDIFAKLTAEPIIRITGEPGKGSINQLPYITDHEDLCIISLQVHFPQTSAFLESQAGSKYTCYLFNECVLENLNCVPHVPWIQKLAEIHQK